MFETDIASSDRFLVVQGVIPNELAPTWKQYCIKRCEQREKDIYYHKFMEWIPAANDIILVTSYAYADMKLPKLYTCFFNLAEPSICYESRGVVTQAFWGGWYPQGGLSHGHKHVITMRVDEENLAVFDKIHKMTSFEDQIPAGNPKIGICEKCDFEHITTKVILQ